MIADSLLSVELSEMMTATGSLVCDLTTDKADRQANSPRFRVGIKIASFVNKIYPFVLMVQSRTNSRRSHDARNLTATDKDPDSR